MLTTVAQAEMESGSTVLRTAEILCLHSYPVICQSHFAVSMRTYELFLNRL